MTRRGAFLADRWGRLVASYSPGGATPRDLFQGFVARLFSRENPGPDVARTAPIGDPRTMRVPRIAFLALLAAFLALPTPAADACPCPEQPKPKVAVQRPIATAYVTAAQKPPPKHTEPSGTWLLGGGPIIYKDFGHDSTKVGAAVVTGYRLKHDWEFLIGPTWTPHSDFTVIPAYGCPVRVNGASGWGGQALVVYEF